MALKLIRRLCPHHRIHLFIDNSQIVDLITRVILTPPGDFYFFLRHLGSGISISPSRRW